MPTHTNLLRQCVCSPAGAGTHWRWHLSCWSLIKSTMHLEVSPLCWTVMRSCPSVPGRLQSYYSELCFWCGLYWWVTGVTLRQQAGCPRRDPPQAAFPGGCTWLSCLLTSVDWRTQNTALDTPPVWHSPDWGLCHTQPIQPSPKPQQCAGKLPSWAERIQFQC